MPELLSSDIAREVRKFQSSEAGALVVIQMIAPQLLTAGGNTEKLRELYDQLIMTKEKLTPVGPVEPTGPAKPIPTSTLAVAPVTTLPPAPPTVPPKVPSSSTTTTPTVPPATTK
jgi:hypothetical protein